MRLWPCRHHPPRKANLTGGQDIQVCSNPCSHGCSLSFTREVVCARQRRITDYHKEAWAIIAVVLVLIAACCLWVLFREHKKLPILPWQKPEDFGIVMNNPGPSVAGKGSPTSAATSPGPSSIGDPNKSASTLLELKKSNPPASVRPGPLGPQWSADDRLSTSFQVKSRRQSRSPPTMAATLPPASTYATLPYQGPGSWSPACGVFPLRTPVHLPPRTEGDPAPTLRRVVPQY
jgi:hypothetical protein